VRDGSEGSGRYREAVGVVVRE
jgi:hypothetical protein